MPFIPHTDDDTREMLEAIGAPDLDALFDEIPKDLLIESLDGVPEAAYQIIRKNEMMQWTLERVRQGYYSLIHAQALPSEGWDMAAKELADSIENALKIQKEQPVQGEESVPGDQTGEERQDPQPPEED